MMEIFAKSSLRLLALSYFAKSYIIDVSQDPKYSFLVLFGNLLNFEFNFEDTYFEFCFLIYSSATFTAHFLGNF